MHIIVLYLIIFFPFYLISSPLQGFIKDHIYEPETLLKEFQRMGPARLAAFETRDHQNAFHLVIEALLEKRERIKAYDSLLERIKPALIYLKNSGVSINGVDENRKTPLWMVQDAYANNRGTEAKLKPLEDFLVHKMGADPSCLGLEFETRRVGQLLKLLCCPWCTQPDQEEKSHEE